MVEILPSILAADFARLGEEIAAVDKAGAAIVHVDVMDGHFVPNITLGPPVVECVRRVTKSKLDVHLMIADPDRYAAAFVQAGADHVLVHQEVCPHLDRTLRLIQSEGALAGVAINPSTTVALLDDVLAVADIVLVMSVNPGFGGQKFIPNALNKIRALALKRRELGLGFKIETDGGVGLTNVGEVARAGCDWIVTGSAIFHTSDPGATFRTLERTAREALLNHI